VSLLKELAVFNDAIASINIASLTGRIWLVPGHFFPTERVPSHVRYFTLELQRNTDAAPRKPRLARLPKISAGKERRSCEAELPHL
jgi:hypothetical protein